MTTELNGTHDEDQEEPTGALQKNVLTALCFDKNSALLIRRIVEPTMFADETSRCIAKAAADYIDEFAQPPGHHLPDLLEKDIERATPRRREELLETVHELRERYKGLDSQYVVSRLQRFVREQRLAKTVRAADRALQAGHADAAEMILRNGLNERIETFDPGVLFWKPSQALRFFDALDYHAWPLNIKPLDAVRIGPTPGELLTFIAPSGTGKTWFLGHVAKLGVRLRKKTLFVSMEMNEDALSHRFFQSYFRYGKRRYQDAVDRAVERVSVCDFLKDTDEKAGRQTLQSIERRRRRYRTLDDKRARAEIIEYSRAYGRRLPLIIRYFPPAALTMDELQVYLDNLDRQDHFQPDVLIMDYADLMQQDTNNLRMSLEQTYQKLRGLAVERNLAVVTASQANRQGGQDDTKLLTLAHVAESVGKVNVADNVITYNQSRKEQPYGLARLFVAKARNEASHFTVAITQAYQIGQFCLDAIRISDEQYWECVDELVDSYGEE